MKNKQVIALLGIVCLVILVLGIVLIAPAAHYSICDLHFRYNEISCSHTGINPFRIWNYEVTSEVYQPLARQQGSAGVITFADDHRNASDKLMVHSYPAWHTTYFWFYGWMSRNFCDILMYSLYAAILVGFIVYLRRWQPVEKTGKLFYWGFILMMLREPFMQCFYFGNYGFIMLFFSVLLYESLKRKNAIAGGAAWAVMMMKPNVSMMLFWPLLFNRRWRTIVIAVAICVLALLWPAYLYHESPLALLTQISQAGVAYFPANSPSGILYRKAGVPGVQLWMLAWFLVCGGLTYALRKVPSWRVQLLPALLLSAIWSFSKSYDRTVFWVLYVEIALQLTGRGIFILTHREKRILWGYVIGCIVLNGTSTFVDIAIKWHLVRLPALPFVMRGTAYLFLGMNVLLLGLMALKAMSKTSDSWNRQQME